MVNSCYYYDESVAADSEVDYSSFCYHTFAAAFEAAAGTCSAVNDYQDYYYY